MTRRPRRLGQCSNPAICFTYPVIYQFVKMRLAELSEMDFDTHESVIINKRDFQMIIII